MFTIFMFERYILLKEEADDLVTFREKWQKELKISSPLVNVQSVEKTSEKEDNESKAKKFFIEGIEMEKAGKMYEAIQCYRRAVQIVPDIEFKVDIVTKPKSKDVLPENTEDGKIFLLHSMFVQSISFEIFR